MSPLQSLLHQGSLLDHFWGRGKLVPLQGSFRLPENVKVDEIKASMHDGVLIVTVPKDEHKKKGKHHKAVEIVGKEQNHDSKGLSRFVCCKA
ncbi:hypothetical protein SLA2020_527060 [Shorea laevis]